MFFNANCGFELAKWRYCDIFFIAKNNIKLIHYYIYKGEIMWRGKIVYGEG